MKENYDACLALTLSFEGGFVNDPRDPGGATNMGIARATLAAWRRRPVSIADVRNLAIQEAAEIYRAWYWSRVGGDALPAGVDLMLFDIAVNMGAGRAARFAMRTCRLTASARIRELDRLRCGFWRALRAFPVFGKGWMRRERACLDAATRMAANLP